VSSGHSQPEHFAGNDALAVQEDQAMHRANELVFGISPAHDFRDRQFPQRCANDLGQVRASSSPFFSRRATKYSPLPSVSSAVAKAHAGRAHEAFECPGRFAGGVERTGNRRALLFQHAVGLAGGNPGDGQRQAARGGVGVQTLSAAANSCAVRAEKTASAKASDST
jgi:hypothetical protein